MRFLKVICEFFCFLNVSWWIQNAQVALAELPLPPEIPSPPPAPPPPGAETSPKEPSPPGAQIAGYASFANYAPGVQGLQAQGYLPQPVQVRQVQQVQPHQVLVPQQVPPQLQPLRHLQPAAPLVVQSPTKPQLLQARAASVSLAPASVASGDPARLQRHASLPSMEPEKVLTGAERSLKDRKNFDHPLDIRRNSFENSVSKALLELICVWYEFSPILDHSCPFKTLRSMQSQAVSFSSHFRSLQAFVVVARVLWNEVVDRMFVESGRIQADRLIASNFALVKHVKHIEVCDVTEWEAVNAFKGAPSFRFPFRPPVRGVLFPPGAKDAPPSGRSWHFATHPQKSTESGRFQWKHYE